LLFRAHRFPTASVHQGATLRTADGVGHEPARGDRALDSRIGRARVGDGSPTGSDRRFFVAG